MKLKKMVSVLLVLAFAALLFAGCAQTPSAPINVGGLKGPTGMGMTKLMGEEYAEKYAVTLTGAPDDITAKLISGELDVAAVPVNLASVLYNKTEGDIVMLAVNTLGVLYVLENGDTVHSLADLSGKTLLATGQGSTPEYMLNYLLAGAGLADSVTVEYKAEHSELATLMASGDVALGMLPEPNVTSVLMGNENVRIALDLTEIWKEAAGVEPVQGCIVARKEYLDQNKKAVEAFLADYAKSVAYVNENIDDAAALMETYGVIPKAAVAKNAIPNSNIVCVTGADMRTMAEAMLTVLFDANPKSVGGALPGDDFYYSGK